VGPKPFTHSGLVISAVAHVTAALVAVLFAGANPFNSVATQAIAVDIVSPSDVPAGEPESAGPEGTGPEKVPGSPHEQAPDPNNPFSLAMTPQQPAPSTPAAPPSPPTKPAQRPDPSRAKQQQAASPPTASQRGAQPAALQPSLASPAPVEPPAPEIKEASLAPNVADMFAMPLALPDGRLGGGFDAPAYESAKVERSSVDALRAHLKTCTSLPAGVAPDEKISLVIRVNLKADGTLAGQPALIQASASPKGPLILQNLLGGLAKCQPYNMLPADKYQEWKSLDMRFTPGDLGPG
jgi:hypothetical protein